MRITILAASACLALAGCGRHDPTPGEQAAKAADNRADAIDQGAGKIEGPPAATMHDAADAVRDQGKAEKDALDRSGAVQPPPADVPPIAPTTPRPAPPAVAPAGPPKGR